MPEKPDNQSDEPTPRSNAAKISHMWKTAKIASTLVGLGMAWWMTVMWSGQGRTNENLVSMEKAFIQGIGELKAELQEHNGKMDVFNERLNHHNEMKRQLDKLDDANRLLEERLRQLERAVKP